MSKRIYVISDLHLGHKNVLDFTIDGTDAKLRDFNSIQEMNGTIIDNWNNTVRDQDTVYVLGDIAWGEDSLLLMKAMKGKKILVKGNHDNLWNVRKFLDVFQDVHGVKPISFGEDSRCVLTHVPIHPDSVERWGVNIHGHLHANNIDDPRYFNVSCEQVNYTPMDIREILYNLNTTTMEKV